MQKSSTNLLDDIKNENTEKSSMSSKDAAKGVAIQKSAKVIQTTPQLSDDKNRSRISIIENAGNSLSDPLLKIAFFRQRFKCLP